MNRLIITLLMATPVISVAQKKTIYGKITTGNYWMRDVKHLQEEIKDQAIEEGIPAEIMLSFPVSVQGEVGLDFIVYDKLLRKYTIGGFINYTFTGGMINYSDYSGTIDIEQNLQRISVGAKGAFEVTDNIQAYAKLAYQMTNFQLITRTTLNGTEPDEHKDGVDPVGVAIEPGLQWTKTVKQFNFFLHAGYELSTIVSSNGYFTNAAGDSVHPGWSGFRLGAGLGFSF